GRARPPRRRADFVPRSSARPGQAAKTRRRLPQRDATAPRRAPDRAPSRHSREKEKMAARPLRAKGDRSRAPSASCQRRRESDGRRRSPARRRIFRAAAAVPPPPSRKDCRRAQAASIKSRFAARTRARAKLSVLQAKLHQIGLERAERAFERPAEQLNGV